MFKDKKTDEQMKKNLLLIILFLNLTSVLLFANSSSIYDNNSILYDYDSNKNPYSSVFATTPNNVTELQLFFDEIFENQIMDYQIPGVTLSVVNATDVLYLKGYGYADVEESKPVSPTTSMFRAASISKLFVWTSMMQLYEQGLLDLHANVNDYLTTFKIPNKFGAPITPYHLMSHSAGFEQIEHLTGKITKVDLLPFIDYLTDYMPNRVLPPGEVSIYSNYGAALAGYIVSQISNMSFEEYVEENIFDPLGMTYSTLRQPIPSEFADDLAIGYSLDSNEDFQAESFEYINAYPAGSLSMSALDAAKFMMAHLNNGSLGLNQILEGATAQEMHQQHFTHHPLVDGLAHGFMELTINGHRIIRHGGDLEYFHSALLLLLDQNIGFFFNYNAGHERPRMDVIYEFMDHFFPDSEPSPSVLTPPEDFKDRGKRLEGNYNSGRSPFGTPVKIQHIINYIHIDVTDDGYLLFGPFKFVEIDNLVFRDHNGTVLIVFKENSKGKIAYMCLSMNPVGAYIKQLGVDNAAVAWTLGFTGIGILLYTLSYSFIEWIIRKKHQQELQRSKTERIANKLSIVTSIGYILHIGIFGGLLATLFVSDKAIPFLKVLQVIPLLLMIPLGLLTIYTIFLWKDKLGRLIFRINRSLVIFTVGFLLWWMNNWNWLGFNFF